MLVSRLTKLLLMRHRIFISWCMIKCTMRVCSWMSIRTSPSPRYPEPVPQPIPSTRPLLYLSLLKEETIADISLNDRGGEEVLLDVGGQDATEAFEDVGHSDEAREILEGLLIGDLKRKVGHRLPPPPIHYSLSLLSFFLPIHFPSAPTSAYSANYAPKIGRRSPF